MHALVGSTVKLGTMASPSDGIALTADNLVGVTKDGGTSWGFMRHGTGVVLAIAGKAGGPFLAVGKAGFAAMSVDGKVWQDLPRYTNEELISVAVDGPGIVAIAKNGTNYVTYGLDGKTGSLGLFPDKIKAKDVVASGGRLHRERRQDALHVARWLGVGGGGQSRRGGRRRPRRSRPGRACARSARSTRTRASSAK